MIAQALFTLVLFGVALAAFTQLPRIPVVGSVVIGAALFGAILVWMPDDATYLAKLVGIGRGADLVLYTWVLITCAIMLLLYLNLREQLALITTLARRMALVEAVSPAKPLSAPQSRTAR